mmetsp:Transcript_1649/g.6054  ORF Transcript_1649/g.6054 Transcript_1649/m.6054 type:complete len:207 (+) Transcript_1649:1945-2565(+)
MQRWVQVPLGLHPQGAANHHRGEPARDDYGQHPGALRRREHRSPVGKLAHSSGGAPRALAGGPPRGGARAVPPGPAVRHRLARVLGRERAQVDVAAPSAEARHARAHHEPRGPGAHHRHVPSRRRDQPRRGPPVEGFAAALRWRARSAQGEARPQSAPRARRDYRDAHAAERDVPGWVEVGRRRRAQRDGPNRFPKRGGGAPRLRV